MFVQIIQSIIWVQTLLVISLELLPSLTDGRIAGKIAAGFSNPLGQAEGERSERVVWTAAALHPGATMHALGARADLVKQNG